MTLRYSDDISTNKLNLSPAMSHKWGLGGLRDHLDGTLVSHLVGLLEPVKI